MLLLPDPLSLVVEFAYFVAIFLLSTWVYLQTRGLYGFSDHSGIRYFGNAFFFFSIIYLCRFAVLDVQILAPAMTPDLQVALQSCGLFLVIFFSLLAILNLMASFSWERFSFISDNKLNLLAVLIACAVFFEKTATILLLLGFVAAAFLVVKAYSNYEKGKKVFSSLLAVYTLLVVFWLFDLVPTLQQLIQFEFQVVGYVGSVLVFLYIGLKVNRVLGAGK